jgi:hypothetical protein
MTQTQNDFLLGGNGEALQPILPIVIRTREQAYRTAAWIKLMGVILPHEDEESTFEEVEEAIRNT